MANRRRGALLPDDLDLDALKAAPGVGRPQPPFHELAALPPPLASPAPMENDERTLKEKAVATTLYLLPADHKRLKKLAVDQNISLQTVVLDALDLLLVGRGEARVERWDTRRKMR